MRLIGRYEVAGEVESGGAVYKAIDPATPRTVEIRTVDLKQLAAMHDAQAPDRLIEALRTLSTLSHPNIAAIFDVLKQDDSLYIVSETFRGRSLQEMVVVQGSIMATDDLVLEMREVSQALDYAHRKGAIHGALSAEHIIFLEPASHGERLVKITGFGYASILSPQSPSHMAPEQAAGSAPSARSDQFSLAAIAYELLYGRILAPPGSVSPPGPNGAVSESVGKVLARALAQNPEERFASASDFFGALSVAIGESKHLPPTLMGRVTADDRAESEAHASPTENPSGSRGSGLGPGSKKLALIVVLLFLVAATIMFIVRMNSGAPIPVQVIDTQSAPMTPAPAAKEPAARLRPYPQASTPPRAEQHAPSRHEPSRPIRSEPELGPTESQGAGSRTADIDLLSDPPGARIVVDQRSDATCHAPCTMTLPVGRHTLVAQLNGYTIAQRIFTVPDTTNLYVQLAQTFGLVVLSSTPAGATVAVDGRTYGRTPVTLRLSVGVHRITLLNGSQRHDETVNVEAESMQSRNIRW